MNSTTRRAFIWTGAIALLCALFLVGTYVLRGPDYTIKLPGGYELTRVYSDTVALTKDGWSLLEPTVDKYCVSGALVAGHVSKAANFCSISGYFVLDTDTGKLWKGLDEKQWIRVLQKYGISKKPNLHRPTGFDALFQ